MTEIKIQMNDKTIITPKTVEISGYHIIGKDDKIILTLPSTITRKRIDDIKDVLDEFTLDDSIFLVMTDDCKIVILEKDV